MKSLIPSFRRFLPEPTRDDQTRSAGDLIAYLSDALGVRLHVGAAMPTRTGTLVIRATGDAQLIVKLAIADSASERLRQNARALQTLAAGPWLSPALKAAVPAPVLIGMWSDKLFTVESTVPGTTTRASTASPRDLTEVSAAAMEFITGFHTASRRMTTITAAVWAEHFRPSIDAVAELTRGMRGGDTYQAIAHYLRDQLIGRDLPLVFAHGNYWIGNLLFDERRKVAGVVDWDCFETPGLPFVDALYFFVRLDSLLRRTSLGEAVARWLDWDVPAFARWHLESYARNLAIPADLTTALTYCAWIQHVAAGCRFKAAPISNRRWLERNVAVVLKRPAPSV